MEKINCKAAITDGRGNFSIEQIEVEEPSFDEIPINRYYENGGLMLENLI